MKERAGKWEGQKEGENCSIHSNAKNTLHPTGHSSVPQWSFQHPAVYPYTSPMLWALVWFHPAVHGMCSKEEPAGKRSLEQHHQDP